MELNAQEPSSFDHDGARLSPREGFWFLLVLIAGVMPRLIFVYLFPTQPTSDFRIIVIFAEYFSKDIFARDAIGLWRILSPGTSLFLSFFLRFIPNLSVDPGVNISSVAIVIARTTTALVTGLLPVFPFLIWRNTFSLRVRLLTAFLFAFWPGQILFSGVPAQDNWILLPTVALGALAIRTTIYREQGRPVLAAILFFLGVLIRQEMLIALFPMAAVVAIGKTFGQFLRNALLGFALTFFLFSAFIVYKGSATGEYSLSTRHYGSSFLGSVIPVSGIGWSLPHTYLAAVDPDLLERFLVEPFNPSVQDKLFRLGIHEVLRRPGYSLVRTFASPIHSLVSVYRGGLYWSVTRTNVLPEAKHEQARRFAEFIMPLIDPVYFHAIFISALALSIHRKWHFDFFPVLAAILLKFGIHAILVSTERYFYVILALEILIIAIVVDRILSSQKWREVIRAVLVGSIISVALYSLTLKSVEYVRTHGDRTQRDYRFPLQVNKARFDCEMKQGYLKSLTPTDNYLSGALIEFSDWNPAPSSKAVVTCTTEQQESRSFKLLLSDSYARGGLPGRVLQSVYVNDVEVVHHDLADENWVGWKFLLLLRQGRPSLLQWSLQP